MQWLLHTALTSEHSQLCSATVVHRTLRQPDLTSPYALQCMHENFEKPATCQALVEDYMECLHHRKYVSVKHRGIGVSTRAAHVTSVRCGSCLAVQAPRQQQV